MVASVDGTAPNVCMITDNCFDTSVKILDRTQCIPADAILQPAMANTWGLRRDYAIQNLAVIGEDVDQLEETVRSLLRPLVNEFCVPLMIPVDQH